MRKIACVIPTIRFDKIPHFLSTWNNLFTKHNVDVVIVKDGEDPIVDC